MSYKIIYGKVRGKPSKWNIIRIQMIVCVFLLIFSVCVRLFWPDGADLMRQCLVSEELSSGAQAVVALVEGLEDGESFADTVAVFCQELIHGR